jgi:hypothetical protein
MHINYLAIIIAAIAQFIIGAIWYMPLFGNLWGKIHGMEKVSKEERQKMMKSMWPFLALQFLVTLVTTFVLAIFITYQPTWNAYAMAAFFWIGFVVPTQVSGVIFGGTKPKWIVAKILVQAGGSFLCLEVAAAIIRAML